MVICGGKKKNFGSAEFLCYFIIEAQDPLWGTVMLNVHFNAAPSMTAVSQQEM